jgi:putative DNA primase/helicase
MPRRLGGVVTATDRATTRNDGGRATAAHLEAVLGDQTGWVFLGIGTDQSRTDIGKVTHNNWQERSFRWPAQTGDIIDVINVALEGGADIFYTPSLSENPLRERDKRKPKPVATLWADLDGDHDPDRVAHLHDRGGCYTAASGTSGRSHLYLPLVDPADPDTAEDLLRRLAAWLGADPAVTWHGAYLRPAGTRNWKPTVLTGETPGPVELLDDPCEPVWTVDALDDLLPPVASQPATGDVPEAEPVDELPAELDQIINEPVAPGMDRSARTITAVRACVRSGLTPGQIVAVMRRHRPTIEKYDGRADAEVTRALTKVNVEPASDGTTRHAEGALSDGHRATDVGNAARLLELADGQLRYVHAWGKWLVYRSGRWTLDENDVLVTEYGKRVARHLFKIAARIENNRDERDRVWKWALRSETAGSIAAMVRLARGAPGILVEHEDLDADPYLLNVRNGTIDLRTGRLRPHDPADLLTLQCPIPYDPDARSPLWEAAVDRWQPDLEVRDYIQRRAGAGATGHPTETVDVDYGGGGNGKSKFWGAIQHVLGDYAVIPHKSLLVAQRHEQHATVVARLFRKRLAVASETRAADTLDDEQVKNLTGGDRLSGRRMREDPWEFEPSHTLVMFSNHKPAVQGRDEGIWRRLRLVPWKVTIPEDERDPNLGEKLRAEAPAVLAWVVDGARRFIAEGLNPPDAVRVATERYRSEEDTVGRFINEVLVIGDGWAMSVDIKAELEAWCDEQGIDPPQMNEVTDTLRALGCRDGGRRRMHGKRSTIWHGVRVAEIRGYDTDRASAP